MEYWRIGRLGSVLFFLFSGWCSAAPVFVRVNTRKATRDDAIRALAAEGIGTAPHATVATALEVTSNARRLASSGPYRDGWIELQDAHSQAVVADLAPGPRVLDYCAGAGGKTLALAALTGQRVTACDIDPGRMRDVPDRAARAGATVDIVPIDAVAARGPFDLVLCDAPCSGSGTWRRDPEGKWALTPERLAELKAAQDGVLRAAAPLVAPGGRLIFVICCGRGPALARRRRGRRLRSGDPAAEQAGTI